MRTGDSAAPSGRVATASVPAVASVTGGVAHSAAPTAAVAAVTGPVAVTPAQTNVVAAPQPKLQPAAEAARPKPVEKPVVIWPKLRLSGVLGGGTKSGGAAIINGRVLERGQSIDGVVVRAVDRQAIELEYQDEKRLLKINESTE